MRRGKILMITLTILMLTGLQKPAVSTPEAAEMTIMKTWEDDYREIQTGIEKQKQTQPPANLSRDPCVYDAQAMIWPTDRDPLDIVLRRAQALAADLERKSAEPQVRELGQKLQAIQQKADALDPDRNGPARKALYIEACAVRRRLALANPLLDFDRMLITTGDPRGNHIQSHFYGKGAVANQLLLVSNVKTRPEFRELLKAVNVENGRLAGQPLRGGAFCTFDLSWDARTLLFEWNAMKKPTPQELGEDSIFNPATWTRDTTYNIFKVNIDGTGLTQLTDTPFNDAAPCWLPDGRVAFVSERRICYVRCHPYGKPPKVNDKQGLIQPCCTLYSMKADGADVTTLSWHETTETFPRVTHDGRIVYTRWDYIDRDFNVGHHLWFCMPDGRDPRSPHGNYPQPHSTMDKTSTWFDPETKKFRDGRAERPWAEYCIRPIPGSPKYLAVASIHHSSPAGELIIIDPRVPDDNAMAQVRRITGARLPREGLGPLKDRREDMPYAWPYPLSEDYYLARHMASGSLVLLDRFGNRDALITGKRVMFAVPVKARPRPPVLPPQTYQGERAGLSEHKPATIGIMNIYDADMPWPKNTKITALRIVQLFPRPWNSPFGSPPGNQSFSGGFLNRMALGTVPVEADGSAYFEAPVNCEIYFQSLDENGLAVHSMRSGTYVHPGEQMSCVGCHEDKWKTATPHADRLAFKRPPSKIQPEIGETEPASYYRLARPVLEGKCIGCHQKNNVRLNHVEYKRLHPYAFFFHASGSDSTMQPLHGGTRTVPGQFGARASLMGRKLLDEKHQGYLKQGLFSKEDVRRLTLWLDLNSHELGHPTIDPAEQEYLRAGGIIWPEQDFDLNNRTRAERLMAPFAGRAFNAGE